MIQADFDTFLGEFRRLSAAFDRFKQSPAEVSARADVYFHVLKKYPLTLVSAKADAWLETQVKFPKPGEWAGQVATKRVELRVMSEAESREYLRADHLGYDDPDPCACASCVAAGVQDRAETHLRYVPMELPDGRTERAKLAGRDTIVTPGQWLHGWPLVRWYEARATFWSTAYAKCGIGEQQQRKLARVPFEQRVARIFATVGGMTTIMPERKVG